jgi:bifunctional non-homologous end joining protein LigD
VTRGPSLDPAEKRLAVRTEDHPLEYGAFEGTIPQGEYGGGTVMIWDRGTWTPRGDPREGLAQGHLKFDLDGERLKGGFALVRLKPRGKETRENWLLVKERDETADRDTDPVALWTTSVATGRDMDEIATSAESPVWSSKQAGAGAGAPSGKARRKSKLPAFVAPQLATLAAEPPEGAQWLHEIKFDGYRVIAAIADGQVMLYTRAGNDWTARFGKIAADVAALNVRSALLDGEIVVLDAQGRSDFGSLQQALKTGELPLTLYVFDLLMHDGKDLRRLALEKRKARLEELLANAPASIRYSDHVRGNGRAVLAKCCSLGLEGVVSKRADKSYVSERGTSWLKTKCQGREEFVIVGYRPSDKKGRAFASLLLGEYEGDELRYRGRVGTGFDEATIADIAARLKPLTRASSPVREVPREIRRAARWVEPQLVAEIAYTERTSDGVLRHPSFLGLREDKRASEVRARPDSTRGRIPDGSQNDAAASVRLTSPEKVLFPGAKLTKADLARYLSAVAPLMLPHLAGRPLSLVRCPEGSGGECFFQKHRKPGMPKAIKSVEIRESDGSTAEYLMVETAEGLVSTAQIGALELHVWGSRKRTLERPDRLVFDLDPDVSVGFAAVTGAALELRDLLAAGGLESFPLLTGGKGVHVVVPLAPRLGWEAVKGFARGLAQRLAEDEPDRFVATMSKARRKGRIFIDWMRNERGATAIAPYSPRARPEASIAIPVDWQDLACRKSANADTIRNFKVSAGRTPWAGYFDLQQTIAAATLKLFA